METSFWCLYSHERVNTQRTHGNPRDTCQDVSLKTRHITDVVALKTQRRDRRSQQDKTSILIRPCFYKYYIKLDSMTLKSE